MHNMCNKQQDIKPSNYAHLLGILALRGKGEGVPVPPAPSLATTMTQ